MRFGEPIGKSPESVRPKTLEVARENSADATARAWLDTNRNSIPPEVYQHLMSKLPEATKPTPATQSETPKAAKQETFPDRFVKEKLDVVDQLIATSFLPAEDRVYWLEKITGENANDMGGWLDFLDKVQSKMDPAGTGALTHKELWDRICALSLDAYGIEIFYPTPGSRWDKMKFDPAGVDRDTRGLRENDVVRVQSLGYAKNGQVLRKAKVIVSA